jgi:hypothetical protein
MEDLWGTVFHIVDPNVIMLCLTCSTLSVWLLGMSLADSPAWQTYLPDTMADDTSLDLSAVAVLIRYWRELCRENCRDSESYAPGSNLEEALGCATAL